MLSTCHLLPQRQLVGFGSRSLARSFRKLTMSGLFLAQLRCENLDDLCTVVFTDNSASGAAAAGEPLRLLVPNPASSSCASVAVGSRSHFYRTLPLLFDVDSSVASGGRVQGTSVNDVLKEGTFQKFLHIFVAEELHVFCKKSSAENVKIVIPRRFQNERFVYKVSPSMRPLYLSWIYFLPLLFLFFTALRS